MSGEVKSTNVTTHLMLEVSWFFVHPKLKFIITTIERDLEGRILHLTTKINNCLIKLVNIYGPNVDSNKFIKTLAEIIDFDDPTPIILCGDFNFVMNVQMDWKNKNSYNHVNMLNAWKAILSEYDLLDVWCMCNPNLSHYMWFRSSPYITMARLDYVFV